MPQSDSGGNGNKKQPNKEPLPPSEEEEGVAEILPPRLTSALRDAGVDTHDPKVTKALGISLSFFSGSLPLPPPSILDDYRAIDPALVNRLIQWTETQAYHRRSLEKQRTDGAEARQNRGQFLAAAIAISGLVLSAIVGIFGNPWAAGAIAIVSVGGPTAAVALAKLHKS